MANVAQKRAAKAHRRKAIVTQKRKLEIIENSLPERVERAAVTPIRHCLVANTFLSQGVGTVLLARGEPGANLSFASFLIDTWCLGIKDTFLRRASAEEFKSVLSHLDATNLMTPADPAYARKLLRDVAAWAATLGFNPHRDFATIERLFGDVDADASDATFTFGCEGKPLYVSGPKDTAAQSRQRVAQLANAVGVGNFDFMCQVGGPTGVPGDDIDIDENFSVDDVVMSEQTMVLQPSGRSDL